MTDTTHEDATWPESILAWEYGRSDSEPQGMGEWYTPDTGADGTEFTYVRADLFVALRTERDALRAQLAKAHEALTAVRDGTYHPVEMIAVARRLLKNSDSSQIAKAQARPAVKPLKWEDHPADGGPVMSKAVTAIGTYFICDDTDDFSGLFLKLISHDKAQWWRDVRSTCETLAEHVHDDDFTGLKATAQAHYQRKISACLEPRPVTAGEAAKVLSSYCAERSDKVNAYEDTVFYSVHDFDMFVAHLNAITEEK